MTEELSPFGVEDAGLPDEDEILRGAQDAIHREALAEQERSYLQLLLALKAQPEAHRHAGLVASIARWVGSERVLRAISAVTAWSDDWEVREALFGNPSTDPEVRSRFGIALAIFELMRELDRPGLEAGERDEIKDEVREQIALLDDHDRDLVKARLKSKAGKKRETTTAVAPALPPPAPAGEIASPPPPAGEVGVAPPAAEPAAVELDPILAAMMAELSTASPLSEAEVAPPAQPVEAPSPETPPSLDPMLAALMAELSGIPAAPAAPAEGAVAMGLFGLDDDASSGIVEREIPPPPPPIAPVSPEPVPPPAVAPAAPPPAPPAPAAPASTAPEAAPEAVPALAPPPASPPSAPRPPMAVLSTEERAQLLALPSDQKAALAAVTNRTDQLAVLIVEKESKIFEAVLDNPNLPEALVGSSVAAMNARQIELLLKRKRWAHKGAIRTAVIFNPNTHPTDAIAILDTVDSPKALMEVMRSPRVLSPQVKQRAKDRLVSRWWAMGTGDRVALIRETGGGLFQDLAEQIFRDDTTLAELIRDRSLEESVVLQLARSAMTPRSVLGSVASNSAWVASETILLELVRNPKTPREAVDRLVPRLRPSDRKALKSDPSIPAALRAKLG